MLFLAIRHLLSQRKQTFLILLGISLGTMVYVAIAGIQLGFREWIIEKLIENDAHVKITGRDEVITDKEVRPYFFKEENFVRWVVPPSGKRDEARIMYPQGWFSRLDALPNVLAYAPQFQVQALLRRGSIKLTAQITGIHTEKQLRVTNLNANMKSGQIQALGQSGNRIVLGTGLAQKLGAQKNETVLISTGSTPVPFKVVGLYESGIQELDDVTAFGTILDVQQLAKSPGRVTSIAIKLDDVEDANPTADQLSTLGIDKVRSWSQVNEGLMQMFTFQDFIRNFISITVLVVAAFGIYNVLTIIINQKKKEIAILRALGFSPREVEKLFLSQGALLGVTGAACGMLLGFVSCLLLGQIKFDIRGLDHLLISYSPYIYGGGFVIAIVSSLIASYLPARAARKMTPIDIIRSGGG